MCIGFWIFTYFLDAWIQIPHFDMSNPHFEMSNPHFDMSNPHFEMWNLYPSVQKVSENPKTYTHFTKYIFYKYIFTYIFTQT